MLIINGHVKCTHWWIQRADHPPTGSPPPGQSPWLPPSRHCRLRTLGCNQENTALVLKTKLISNHVRLLIIMSSNIKCYVLIESTGKTPQLSNNINIIIYGINVMITGKNQGKFEEFDSTCKLAFICISNYDVFNVESCSSGFDHTHYFMCGNY